MAKGKNGGLRARAGKVKRRTETVFVCTDGEAVGQLHYLGQKLLEAQRDDDEERAEEIARQIGELEDHAREQTVEITVGSIGKRWSDLLGDHGPTKAQKAKGIRDYNPDSFPFAAIAASIISIDGEPDDPTPEDVRIFFKGDPDDPESVGLPDGEFATVFLAVQAVNVGQNTVPFNGRASALLRGSARSSKPAEPGESPAPTS